MSYTRRDKNYVSRQYFSVLRAGISTPTRLRVNYRKVHIFSSLSVGNAQLSAIGGLAQQRRSASSRDQLGHAEHG